MILPHTSSRVTPQYALRSDKPYREIVKNIICTNNALGDSPMRWTEFILMGVCTPALSSEASKHTVFEIHIARVEFRHGRSSSS